LWNVIGEEFPETLRIPVDTGFEGSILLDVESYEFFKVGELPREFWRTYRTLSGRALMRVARAVARLGAVELETYVEAPAYGLGKRLLGREVLNKLIVVLDGPKRSSCLAEALE